MIYISFLSIFNVHLVNFVNDLNRKKNSKTIQNCLNYTKFEQDACSIKKGQFPNNMI